MASGSTSRLAIPYPVPSDPNNVPADVQALAARLDLIAATLTGTETLTNKTLSSPTTTGVVTEKGVHSPDLSTHTAMTVRGLQGQTGPLVDLQDYTGASVASLSSAGALVTANYDGAVSLYSTTWTDFAIGTGSVTARTAKLAGTLRWYHIIITGGSGATAGSIGIVLGLPTTIAETSHVGQWVKHNGTNGLDSGWTLGFGGAGTIEFHRYGTASSVSLKGGSDLGFTNGDVVEAWGWYVG